MVTYKLSKRGPGAYALKVLTRGGVIARTAYFSKVTGRNLDLASITAAYSLITQLRGAAGYEVTSAEWKAKYLSSGQVGAWRAPDEPASNTPRIKRFRLLFFEGVKVLAAIFPEARSIDLCVLLAKQTFEETVTK